MRGLVKQKLKEQLAKNSKANNKTFFKYIRSRKPAKQPVGPLDDRDTKGALTDDKVIAEKLNEFFASVFTAEDVGEIPQPELTFVGNKSEELSQIEVSVEEILELIDKLNCNKSPGPDGIHPRVLKELKCEIAELLTRVCNLSFKSASVPNDWKIANVTPIFKKGSRGDPGNYRPVSLTSVPGKLVETIVKNKIVRHIEEHKLLGKSQHGFCKGKSCLTNLLEFFERVNKHVDKGDPVDIVYLDFQKAFDKVPHQRLLRKLSCHGIRGKILSWIETWLKNREQRVGINGKFSQWRGVTSGVSQGSVLGPILFNLFINDLEEGVNSEVAKFADDTKLLKIVKTKADCEELQKDLAKLNDWMHAGPENCEGRLLDEECVQSKNLTMRTRQRKRPTNEGKIELRNRITELENEGESQAVTKVGRTRKKRRAASPKKRWEETMEMARVLIPRMIEDDMQKIGNENRKQEDLQPERTEGLNMDTARALAPPLPQGLMSPQEQIAAFQVENQKLCDQVQQLQTGNHSFQEQATAHGGAAELKPQEIKPEDSTPVTHMVAIMLDLETPSLRDGSHFTMKYQDYHNVFEKSVDPTVLCATMATTEDAEPAWTELQQSKPYKCGIWLCLLHHQADDEGTGEYSSQQQLLLRQQDKEKEDDPKLLELKDLFQLHSI
ncbi:uncharacterized protein RBU57_000458 [Macrochelys suwanniensis]